MTGPVTLIGDEPHHPYERPPLSKDVLSLDDAPPPKWVSTPESFAEKRIACITGKSAVAIDRAAKTVALLRRHVAALRQAAAGDRRRAAAPAACRAGRRSHRLSAHLCRCAAPSATISCRDATSPSSAAASSDWSSRPAPASAAREVTIIEAQPRILMRGVPEEIAAIVAARHRAEGVELHLRRWPDARSPRGRTASASSSATAARSMPIWP